MFTRDQETIVAQCSPSGSGAIGLIRLSGINALEVADKISSKKISAVPTHTIHYGSVLDRNGLQIDKVLFLVMHGPHTFTGQNTVEITCHNNPFIIQTIIQEVIKAGARLADNGEFTRRSMLNDKIDLVQAEAINELIHANTQHTLKQSLKQLDGSFSNWIATIEKDLIKALALSEASFEFIEEENLEFGTQIKNIITAIESTITQLKKTFDQQQHIRNGIRIALIGSVNAGKSSLFNSLLNAKRAIVTNLPGTTRDVIEAGLYKNGNYWTLIDTAGIRKTNNLIEKEGIKRSFEEAHKADVILLVVDGSKEMDPIEQSVYQDLFEQFKHKCLVIRSKIDLPQASIEWLSHKNYHPSNLSSMSSIEQFIENKIQLLFDSIESPFLINRRQFNLMLRLEQKLAAITQLLDGPIAYELVSYHLNTALADLAELTGKSISEAGMDAVFREFCVGK
jgi:tRNA modification GTPase